MSSVPVISSPATLPVNVKLNASPCCSPYVLRSRTRVAVDRAGEIARDEVALVRALDLRCPAGAGEARASTPPPRMDLHVPAAGQVAGRRRRRLRRRARRLAQHGVQPIGDDLLVARRHHVGRDRDAGPAIADRSPASRRPRRSCVMRGSPSNSVRDDRLAGRRRACARSQRIAQRRRLVRQAVGLRRSRWSRRRRSSPCAAMWSSQPVQRFHSASWSRFTHISTAISIPIASSLPTLKPRAEPWCGALWTQAALTRSLRPSSRPAVCGPRRHLPPL